MVAEGWAGGVVMVWEAWGCGVVGTLGWYVGGVWAGNALGGCGGGGCMAGWERQRNGGAMNGVGESVGAVGWLGRTVIRGKGCG